MSFEETISRIQEYIKEYFKDCVVYTKENDIHYFRNSKNIIKSKLHKSSKTKPNKEHNRYKNYLLSNPEQYKFLYYLGISDENGRIYDKGQKKFVQINNFLQILDQSIDKIEFENKKIKVIDYCCGKGYLTMAVYHYLKDIKNLKAEVLGVDLKEDVINDLNKMVKELELKDINFLHKDIKQVDEPVDIAIGLHACDIATDIFLTNGVKNRAKLIISVPCCQHQLFSQIQNTDLKSILDFGLQKDRFTEMLTNSLRVLALKKNAYQVDLLEFASIEHTMKNVLIRAVLKDKINNQSVLEDKKNAEKEYDKLKKLFNVNEFEGDRI